jgi:lipoprotein-releasing system permease protein
MQIPFEFYLALRYLRVHRGRSFLSVITLISMAGVIVGTAALIIALSMMAGFIEDVRARIHSGSAHLTVVNAGNPRFEGAAELVQQTAAVEGVQAASPVLYTPAMLTRSDNGTPAFAEIHGVDAEGHVQVTSGQPETDSPFDRLDEPTVTGREGILLGSGLAQDLGAIRGDLVRVMVPQVTLAPWSPVPRSSVFEVVGTYSSTHFQEDSVRAYLRLDAVRRVLRAPDRTSWVEVRLDDLRELEPMKLTLQAALDAPYLVIDLIEQNQEILRALKTERLLLMLAIGLIVVVAALNIVSTLVLMVIDKIKEIGTLTALGTLPGMIARIFMLQGLVIGSVGAAIGVVLGAGIAFMLDRYEMIKLDPDVYFLDHLPLAIQRQDLLFVGIAALLVSFLATLYPAFRAARLDPVEALRHD